MEAISSIDLSKLAGLYNAQHNIKALIENLVAANFENEEGIWVEIGEQIYQQNDVCLLSYSAIFQLANIYLSNQKIHLQLLTYAAIIEMQRCEIDILPIKWIEEYEATIQKLLTFSVQQQLDKNSCVAVSCLLAAVNKQYKIAQRLMNS